MCCELCGREARLTFHHLIPRRVHRMARFIKRFGKAEMRTRGINVCRLCHKGIHELIPDLKELAESYHTKELLLSHPAIHRHVQWASRQKIRFNHSTPDHYDG